MDGPLNWILPLMIFVADAVGQREVEMEVHGDTVLQMGIRTYAVYSDSYDDFGDEMKSVTVKCSMLVSVPLTLTLLRGNEILSQIFTDVYDIDATTTLVLRYNRHNQSSLGGTYICQINGTGESTENSTFAYSMESTLNIVTERSPICASNIGYSAYLGETAILSCGRYSYVSYEYIHNGWRWKSSNNYESHSFTFPFYDKTFKMTCSRYGFYGWEDSCHSPDFNIYRFLSVELSQRYDVVNSSDVEFTCNSTPPRLMYWELFGKNGNILDLYQFNQSFNVDGNIIIKQSAGITSIRISGSIVTQKCIHTVVCSTYGTRARAVAYANLGPIFQDATECDENVSTISSYSPTSEQNLGTTTTWGNTVIRTGLRPTKGKDTPMTQITPIICKEERNVERLTVKYHFMTGVLVLLLISLIILTVIICYMIYKLKRPPNMKRSLEPTSVHSETHLHENPVYLPFSLTPDSVQCDDVDEKECTYANL